MYAQSGRTRSRTGTGRGNNRASSAASSSSAGNGQPNPCCAVRFRYSVTVPTPMAQAWAIARWDNPRSCLSRRTSRIFLISSLRAGIASPLPSKGQKHAGSGYRRAFTMTEIGVQLPEIGVQLRPKPVFNFARNRCSTSSEKPNYTLSDEDLQNIGAPAASQQQAGLRAAAVRAPLTRAACWLRASSFRRPSWISSDASSTWMETNSPTTRCGPRPDTSILPNCAACTDSGPSRAARRMSSGTGSAKKRHGRSRTRTWCAGSSRPAVTREPSCRPRRRSSGSLRRRAGRRGTPDRTGCLRERAKSYAKVKHVLRRRRGCCTPVQMARTFSPCSRNCPFGPTYL